MISVIVPCYNMASYVAQTLFSLKCQTYDDWECIVIDDRSKDNSSSVILNETFGHSRFTVQMIENSGVAVARNTGIEQARGEYILCLDADDMLVPNALKVFATTWAANPDASLLVPQIHCFGACKDHIKERTWFGYEDLKIRCTPPNSSCFKKKDWERVGGYRSGTMYEDWEFWLRLLYNNDKVINIPEVLIEYRVRGCSRVHEAGKERARELEIIRKLNPEIFK